MIERLEQILSRYNEINKDGSRPIGILFGTNINIGGSIPI